MYKTIDLCAGIGGIRRGFERAGGFINVASAEIDENACKTYERNFGDNPRNDITKDTFKQYLKDLHYDVLLAGFPCQSFSSVGRKKGFEDNTKGTIFFDIAKIIETTNPKAIFLENVQNLLSHDKGDTFKTVIDKLDRHLNYHIIGLEYNSEGDPINTHNAFVRNSRNFGIPQNRPRVYIVAFSRAYFGDKIKLLEHKQLPLSRTGKPIYEKLADVLDKDVGPDCFLSQGYLETLEKHIVKQHNKGYGFGYRIVNAEGVEDPVASALLATGGSGRERNLLYDPYNGKKYAGLSISGKKTPINRKYIRIMTPEEWGRLQGFIGYAFLDENGKDTFAFPEEVAKAQRYKQLGNSVTIPVVEEMARFIQEQLATMEDAFTQTEKRLYGMYGNRFLLCKRIHTICGMTMRQTTLNKCFDLTEHFSEKRFTVKEVAAFLKVTSARASQMLGELRTAEVIEKCETSGYRFRELKHANERCISE